MQFQQFTGPAMAKGVEDTAFYIFNRLAALNEVGGDPGQFGVSPDEFHTWCERIDNEWPQTMLATSTHDTKRSEDVRARLTLLSGIPEPWAEAVRRWAIRNEGLKTGGLPDRNTEYLLYQTLVGAWPITLERLQEYMLKAAREAKRHTSWTAPNVEFEKSLEMFVAGIMRDCGFLSDAREFIEPLIARGRIVSLAQTLIKLTAPGVPDIYQGTEIWNLSLVDPDNRRPVDFEARRQLIGQLRFLSVEEIINRADEGLTKLWVIVRALRLRARLGRYAALRVIGREKDRAIAFSRENVVTVAPRLPVDVDAWGDTAVELPMGRKWQNVFGDGEVLEDRVLLSRLFRTFPVALLGAL